MPIVMGMGHASDLGYRRPLLVLSDCYRDNDGYGNVLSMVCGSSIDRELESVNVGRGLSDR